MHDVQHPWRKLTVLDLHFNKNPNEPLSVLCLGAHSDDIEIGCGGTILRLISTFRKVKFCWVVFGAEGERREEALRSAQLFLKDIPETQVVVHGFKDGYFPFVGAEVKNIFEQIKRDFAPDLVLTHTLDDRHQDHRLICDLTWNTFRSHLILEYEVPKYDGDLGRPNFYVPLDEPFCRKKIENILLSFQSQKAKHWFTEDTFASLMRLRGIESGGRSRYAEAFYAKKLVW